MPRRAASPAAIPLDAVLPAGNAVFLFDFVQGRYQRWTEATGCRPADTLGNAWAAHEPWLALGTPGSPFIPIRAAAGSNGHFYLLDRLGRRLALYDTNAQFLSAFPLPQELKDRSPENLEVHWTGNGVFTFLDLAAGTAWQFSETRTTGGQGDWRLINRIRLPLNLESCLWEPFFRNPCCRIKGAKGAEGAKDVQDVNGGLSSPTSAPALCFDRYFNPLGPMPGSAGSRDSSLADIPGDLPGQSVEARPLPGGPGWLITFASGAGCAEGASPRRYCFQTDRGELQPCSAGGPPPAPPAQPRSSQAPPAQAPPSQ